MIRFTSNSTLCKFIELSLNELDSESSLIVIKLREVTRCLDVHVHMYTFYDYLFTFPTPASPKSTNLYVSAFLIPPCAAI